LLIVVVVVVVVDVDIDVVIVVVVVGIIFLVNVLNEEVHPNENDSVVYERETRNNMVWNNVERRQKVKDREENDKPTCETNRLIIPTSWCWLPKKHSCPTCVYVEEGSPISLTSLG